MRPAAAALLLAALAVAAGCGRDRGPARPPEDSHRARVRAFWQTLNAAADARLRHDCAAALPLYQQALALEPRHEDALYYLGQCLRDLGRPQQARQAFEQLVEANPQSARGHLALGALLASPDPHEPMDPAAAERHLRRAHEINGEETGPLVRLGELLVVTGRPSEARGWFEAALRTNPKSVEAAFLAGFLAWQQGRHAEVSRLAQRLREALKVEAPIKGVLNEGDRRDASRVVAPPLANPLGRTLFGEPVAALRARAAAGPLSDADLVGLWRRLPVLLRPLAARARPAAALAAATR